MPLTRVDRTLSPAPWCLLACLAMAALQAAACETAPQPAAAADALTTDVSADSSDSSGVSDTAAAADAALDSGLDAAADSPAGGGDADTSAPEVAPDQSSADAQADASVGNTGLAGTRDLKFGKYGYLDPGLTGGNLRGGVALADSFVVMVTDSKGLLRAYRIDWEGKPDAAYAANATTSLKSNPYPGSLFTDVDAIGRVYALRSLTAGAKAEVLRLDATGKPDPTFGAQGVAALDPPFAVNAPYDSYVYQTVRKLAGGGFAVVAGYHKGSQPDAPTDWLLLRYTEKGAVDTTFNGSGWLKISTTAQGILQPGVVGEGPDGSLYLTRYHKQATTYLIAKVTAAGKVDSSWGKDGILEFPVGAFPRGLHGLFTDAAGRVYLTGCVPNAKDNVRWDAFAMRRLADGSLDPSFGEAGEYRVLTLPGMDSGSWRSTFFRLWFDAEGRILLGGNNYAPVSGWAAQFLLARLSADGVADPTFPFTKKSGELADISFAMTLAMTSIEVDGHEGLVLPRPDGKSVMAIHTDKKSGKLQLSRWF